MNYSPKLKVAMEKIKKILEKHDIAGLVVLHEPGHSEYFIKVDPSYSCAKIVGNALRVRARLEDYNGNAKERNQVIQDTTNMLKLLSETGGRQVLQLMEISDEVDKITGADHGPGGHTSHETQNN